MYVYIYMYVCIYIYMYVYIYVCVSHFSLDPPCSHFFRHSSTCFPENLPGLAAQQTTNTSAPAEACLRLAVAQLGLWRSF